MYTKPHSVLAQSGLGAVIAASSYSGVFIVGKQIVNFKQSLRSKQRTKNKKKRPQVIEDVVVQATQRRESFSWALNLYALASVFLAALPPRSRWCFSCLEILSPKLNVFSIKCKVNMRQSSRLSKGRVHLQLVHTKMYSFVSILVISLNGFSSTHKKFCGRRHRITLQPQRKRLDFDSAISTIRLANLQRKEFPEVVKHRSESPWRNKDEGQESLLYHHLSCKQ